MPRERGGDGQQPHTPQRWKTCWTEEEEKEGMGRRPQEQAREAGLVKRSAKQSSNQKHGVILGDHTSPQCLVSRRLLLLGFTYQKESEPGRCTRANMPKRRTETCLRGQQLLANDSGSGTAAWRRRSVVGQEIEIWNPPGALGVMRETRSIRKRQSRPNAKQGQGFSVYGKLDRIERLPTSSKRACRIALPVQRWETGMLGFCGNEPSPPQQRDPEKSNPPPDSPLLQLRRDR